MVLIKIDRKTVRRNPKAGATIKYIKGIKNARFELNGKLPKFLKDGVNIHIEEYVPKKFYRGVVLPLCVDMVIASMLADKRAKKNYTLYLEINKEIDIVPRNPEPSHYFEYENPRFECNACKGLIPISDIVKDWSSEDDKALHPAGHDRCPHCRKFDTFEPREYEKIEVVLKERADLRDEIFNSNK